VSSEAGALRWVDAPTLRADLPVSAAVQALAAAFRDLDPSATPPRAQLDTAEGSLLLMPSFDREGLGVKLVTLTPRNPSRGQPLVHAVYVLFDGPTQAPVAVFEGDALTALRTSAVSALATRELARPDARRLVVLGAGVQGAAHLEAMCAVRPIEEAVIVSRTAAAADALAARARGMGLSAATSGPEAVRGAEIVCVCTTSTTPVFDGALLAPGAHVNAVGAYRLDTRELDVAALRDAGIVVETRDTAVAEAGDLVMAFGAGTRARIDADLQELMRGAVVEGHHTIFKSVGLAFEDLVVARAALNRAGR
jgi:ornithine cyclodeaminase/alanine dehydrogenase-like protein (mu-crystallin family)